MKLIYEPKEDYNPKIKMNKQINYKNRCITQDVNKIVGALGEKSSDEFNDFDHLIDEIVFGDGFLYRHIKNFTQFSGLDISYLHDLLSIKKKMADKTPIGFHSSDHLIELADLFCFGIDLYSSSEEFKKWIYSDNKYLDHLSPHYFLFSILGVQKVKEVLRQWALLGEHY